MNYLKRKLLRNVAAGIMCIIVLFVNSTYTYCMEEEQEGSESVDVEKGFSDYLSSKRSNYVSLLDYSTYGAIYQKDDLSYFMNFIIIEDDEEEEIIEESNIQPPEELKTFVVEEKKDIVNSKIKYVDISQLEVSFDMDVSERTGLRKNDFVIFMNNMKYDYSGFFAENAELIYDLCEEYELNEIFFVGLIAAESGWEIRQPHRLTNNYTSMIGGSGMIGYPSLEEGLRESAKHLHENYLTEGGCYYHGTTISGVKVHFCPASPSWEGLVYGCMCYCLH